MVVERNDYDKCKRNTLMKEEFRFIFDMDGTLYTGFDKGKSTDFSCSGFYADLKEKAASFFMTRFSLSREEAQKEYERIKTKYKGEVSLGLEWERGIDRYDYFANTWNLEPELYIEKDENLPELMEQMRGRIALLTAAPRIWAVNVLSFLKLEQAFGDLVYTGEPNIRKPDPLAFKQIVESFDVPPEFVFSIGDQEESDIIPAKSLGMKTIRIGKNIKSSADYTADDLKKAIMLLKEGFYL